MHFAANDHEVNVRRQAQACTATVSALFALGMALPARFRISGTRAPRCGNRATQNARTARWGAEPEEPLGRL